MLKVLYISNIEVPYRTEYFNQLAKKVDLTVLYERKKSSNRDEKWSESVKSDYCIKYLKGLKILKEYTLDIRILKYAFNNYDSIIFGCFNSPSQIFAMQIMKLLKKKYILNLDGEYFFSGPGIKKRIKRFLIKGADKYLIAGEQASRNLRKLVKKEKVHTYHFSSLTNRDLEKNAKKINKNTNNKVLVVGQYYNYKGLDIALQCAKNDESIKYRFVGSGKRNKELLQQVETMKLTNVEIIPFLEKEKLFKEYQRCKCLLLPSRKECWGLVINEAASFGCPIIASNDSGAARDFVEKYWLAKDANTMHYKLLELDKKNYNKKRLLEITKRYSIENNVIETINCLKNLKDK